MKIYLDASVINVYLFGKYSDIEADRFPIVSGLFELINSKKILAIVSLYSIQEIYSFCKIVFSPDNVGHVSKNALSILFKNEFELSGLLTREERLLHRARFNMDDLSDQPHAISAFLNKCDAIVTYDTHFQKIKNVISVYTPQEVVATCL